MRVSCPTLLAALVAGGALAAASDPAPPAAPAAPAPVVVTTGDALTPASEPAPRPALTDPVDFAALRAAYGRREDFGKLCEIDRPAKELARLLEGRQLRPAADLANKWLGTCPVDAGMHLSAAQALSGSGDKKTAELHRRWFVGLTDSVLKTGDGASASSAIETISITEEYAILMRLRLEPVKQSTVAGPPALDLIVGKDDQGKEHRVYFNPKLHFLRLAKLAPDERK